MIHERHNIVNAIDRIEFCNYTIRYF